MKIRVTDGYRGVQRTKGQFIAPGDYDADDPLLLGQSEFLLATGRAVQLDASGKPVKMVVAGPPDRDLAGKPIIVDLPPDQGLLTNAVVPVGKQFPNNADASEVIQPYEIGATEPAVVMGAAHKIAGSAGVKTEGEAREEAAATDAAIEEAEAFREAAAQAAGQPTPERFDDVNVEGLRELATQKGVTPVDADGNNIAISRANRKQLIAALEAQQPEPAQDESPAG